MVLPRPPGAATQAAWLTCSQVDRRRAAPTPLRVWRFSTQHRSSSRAHREWVEAILASMAHDDLNLTTVLDDDYPANLRLIFNLPPFLTYRGVLRADDARSVAVVGTREASVEGLERARRLASQLAEAGVTVLSGLARGIDTAAHQASASCRWPDDLSDGHGYSFDLPAREPRPGRADRRDRSAGVAVLAGQPAANRYLPASEHRDVRDGPGHGCGRG